MDAVTVRRGRPSADDSRQKLANVALVAREMFSELGYHATSLSKLTDAMVSIEGEAMRSVTWVIVEEVKSGDWGVGGKSLTTADVKAHAAGKPPG